MNDLHKRAHRRILVVDDEPQITRVLRTTLASHGYEIRVANDGESALDLSEGLGGRPADYRSLHARYGWT